MNLRLIFALAAFLGVAACGDANVPANSARTAITPSKPEAAPVGAQTAASATAPAAGCPKAPEPKCPTVTRAKASTTGGVQRSRKAKRVAVATRAAGERRAVYRHHAQREAHDDLPKRPYRYHELPRDRYDEPPVGLDDGDRLARRAPHERSRSYREGRVYEDEYSQRRGAQGWHGHRQGEPQRWSHGRHGADRYGAERRRHETHREGYASRSERSYAYEESESYSERTHASGGETRVVGPCCQPARPQAAGFDANGFLTWPGKVPARP